MVFGFLLMTLTGGPLRQTVHETAAPVKLRYLLYLPAAYKANGNERFPLVLHLHGAYQVGNQIEKVLQSGLAQVIEEGKDYPFIAVSPQCPGPMGWSPKALTGLLDQIEKEYRVDPSRIYATGFSMGGRGVWDLASEQPSRFAAIVPICHGSSVANPKKLASTPAWAFHGDKDTLVPISITQKLVDSVKAEGGKVKFTVLKGAGHVIWNDLYKAEEPFKWMLAQRRDRRAP